MLVLAGLAACASTSTSTPALPASAASLATALQARPIVLLGEVHDNAEQHRLRAAALRGLLEGGARPALLMEQFDRERQADIDRVLAQPGATADAVIAAAAPANAGWNWALYRPFITLAITYRLPLLAANVSRADARGAMQGGLASAGFDARVPADIEAAQSATIGASHCGHLDATQARRMSLGQVARDQFMARLIEANAARGVVLLAGNGHVRRDVGVPRWLAPPTRAKTLVIGLLEADDAARESDAYDRVYVTAAADRPDPCLAFGAASK